MLGAIIGDVVGSRFEFNNIKSKNFELFHKKCFFTDDTVLTCAIAFALSDKKNVIDSLQWYALLYPHAGYGGMFRGWIHSFNPQPYNSCGNGSAMRVSAVGWVANSEKEVKTLSEQVTEVTHNHPEGLKAAEVTAMCIYKARKGASKEELRKYIVSQYPQVSNFSYDRLVKTYHFTELAQDSVPQALYCFLISKDFEDCLRTTISIGGDCDTTAAISCAVAEAFYGIPEEFKQKVVKYFNARDKEILLKPIYKIYNNLEV